MKSSIKFFVLILFTCTTLFSAAEVYTWTDKNGKKHFGDKVPAEYEAQSKPVESKPINTLPRSNVYVSEPPQGQPNTVVIPSTRANEKAEKTCAQQWADFSGAQNCFSQCTMKGGGINAAKCSHCQNLPRPRCDK